MTNYRRGVKFEYLVVNYLKRLGVRAHRSAGSHGLFDVVGFTKHQFVLIQCKKVKVTKKTNLQLIPNRFKAELENIENLETPPNCSKEFWIDCGRTVIILKKHANPLFIPKKFLSVIENDDD